MWIFLNNAMLSVVAHREKADKVMVRSRFREDLGRVFPGCRVVDTPTADYRFRTTVTRVRLQQLLADQVAGLSYPNFKGSVKESHRLSTYHDVWDVMERAQERRAKKAPASDLESAGYAIDGPAHWADRHAAPMGVEGDQNPGLAGLPLLMDEGFA